LVASEAQQKKYRSYRKGTRLGTVRSSRRGARPAFFATESYTHLAAALDQVASGHPPKPTPTLDAGANLAQALTSSYSRNEHEMMPTINGFRKSNPTVPHIERAWFQGFMPKSSNQ